MSRQIAAAIFLDGIFNRRSALYRFEHQSPNIDTLMLEIPSWFLHRNMKKKFSKNAPIPEMELTDVEKQLINQWKEDPCFDLPEYLNEYGQKYQEWESEKEEFELTQKLVLIKKWVFWCADFCDLNRDLSLQSNVGDE